MSLEQCTFSQDMAEDCLPTLSSGTNQLSLLSGMPMRAKFSDSESKTDGGQDCKCGKATLDCSIHPSTPESWIASMRDSLALIFQQRAIKQELALRHEVDSTVKSSASLAWYDQNTSTWKTSQQSLITDLEPYLETLPASGMLDNGRLYELPTAGRLTSGIGGGACFPTPTSHDAKKGAYPSEYNRNTPGIAVILGGKPSPMFQEWQMGWPINHSALRESETDKFHCKPQPLGESLEANDAD